MTRREVEIRRAEEPDIDSIVELNFALFQEDAGQRDPLTNLNWPREKGQEHFSRIVLGDSSICLLAEVDGNVVGYLAGYLRSMTSLRPVKIAELESMFVREQLRNQKVGTSLVNKFLEWSKEHGAQRVSVTAYAANEGAIGFYKGLGFEPRSLTLEVGIT